jgi:hypothetical protein
MLRTFKGELDVSENYKRTMVEKLAKKLENEKYPVGEIYNKLSHDLAGYITRQYIGQCLPNKYKHVEKITRGEDKAPVQDYKKLTLRSLEDGEAIETTEENLKDEIKRVSKANEKQESDDFHKELKEEFAKRDLGDVNDVVLRELDTAIERIHYLEGKVRTQEEELEWWHQNAGSMRQLAGNYVKFDENFNTIDLRATPIDNPINLDLIKFKEKILDAINDNIPAVNIEHDGENVTEIGWGKKKK